MSDLTLADRNLLAERSQHRGVAVNFSFFASYVALWGVAIFQALIIVAVLKQLTELQRLVEGGFLPIPNTGLPNGTLAPEFTGFDEHGKRQITTRSLAGKVSVIIFVSPNCSLCLRLAESLRQKSSKFPPNVIVFCSGEKGNCAEIGQRLGAEVPFILEPANEAAARYGVSTFPTAVILDFESRVQGYGHPKDAEELERLVARTIKSKLHEESLTHTVFISTRGNYNETGR